MNSVEVPLVGSNPRHNFIDRAVSSLAEVYYQPKPWERNGLIYKAFGIQLLKRFVTMDRHPDTDYSTSNYFLARSTLKELMRFEYQTRWNEMFHTINNLAFFGMSVLFAQFGESPDNWENLRRISLPSLLLFSPVILIHQYAIMLQRYNRERIYRILEQARSRVKMDKPTEVNSE